MNINEELRTLGDEFGLLFFGGRKSPGEYGSRVKRTSIYVMAACFAGSLLWLPDKGRCTALSNSGISSGTPFASSVEDTQKAGPRSISGTVFDPSGAAIAGAEVILLSGDGKEFSRITSDKDGSFQFEKLAAGTYKIKAQ